MQQLHAVFKGSVNYLGRRQPFLDMDSCKRVKVINSNKKLPIPRRTELHISYDYKELALIFDRILIVSCHLQ